MGFRCTRQQADGMADASRRQASVERSTPSQARHGGQRQSATPRGIEAAEVHGQLSGRDPTPEETLQNRLGQVEFPKQWMDDLEAMGPPDGWKQELKAYAEDAVENTIGSEIDPTGVRGGN